MSSKRFQIDLDRVITATILFILVVAFLGAFIDYQVPTYQGISLGGISLGDTLRKIGESIYDIFYAINPDAMEKIGQVDTNKKAKIGWSLMLVIVMLVAVYYTFLRIALDRISKDIFTIDDHTKKQLSIIFTFVFVGFVILSPLFNVVVKAMDALFGYATPVGVMIFLVVFVIGCLFFGIGFGIKAGATLGREGKNFIKEGFKGAKLPGFIKGLTSKMPFLAKVEEEYYNIGKALSDLKSEIKSEIKTLEHLKEEINKIIYHLDCIIQVLNQPGIKVKDIETAKKVLKDITNDLIKEEKIVDLIVREKIYDEKIERAIEKVIDQLRDDINNILKNILGKDIKDENLRNICKQIIKDLIKEENLLEKLERIDEDIKIELSHLKTRIKDVHTTVNSLFYTESINIESLKNMLRNIQWHLNDMLRSIDKIKLIEIEEQKIVETLGAILRQNKMFLDKFIKERAKKYLAEERTHHT